MGAPDECEVGSEAVCSVARCHELAVGLDRDVLPELPAPVEVGGEDAVGLSVVTR
jgi:hypothetical protein